MHLSHRGGRTEVHNTPALNFHRDRDLDAEFFYSVPTSFHAIAERIPRELRELISEAAEGCLKSNFLTGAMACARNGVHELAAR
jgi:hypothetical protein